MNWGDGCWGPDDNDEEYARARWGILYEWISYGYNYVSLWNTGLASINRPADQIVIYDAISQWAQCPYAQAGNWSCGIWYYWDIPAFLAKLGIPLHPKMKNPLAPGAPDYFKVLIQAVAPHNNTVNFLFADGHVKAGRWDRMTWGNLDRFIPDSDPDWNVPLTTLPSKTWPGM